LALVWESKVLVLALVSGLKAPVLVLESESVWASKALASESKAPVLESAWGLELVSRTILGW
jgi:hypothetical protein